VQSRSIGLKQTFFSVRQICLRSQRSPIERRHNEQPATDQQGQGDTTYDRENAMPAIGRLGPGGGILHRCDTHPEVTHTHGLASATFIKVGHLNSSDIEDLAARALVVCVCIDQEIRIRGGTPLVVIKIK
jgi:hypothetical protein